MILRHLLLLPLEQSRVTRKVDVSHPKDSADSWESGSVNAYRILRVMRYQVDGPESHIWPEVLRVCHTLEEEGRQVLNENQLVKLITPAAISLKSHATYNLSLWRIESVTARTLITLMIMDVNHPGGSGKHVYLFELRNIHFVVRYLLMLCRKSSGIPGASIDIEIVRVSSSHARDVSAAAQKLLLGPVFSHLSREMNAIFYEEFSANLRDLRFDAWKAQHNHTPVPPFKSYTRPASPTHPIPLAVLDALADYSKDPPLYMHMWDGRPAIQIWHNRVLSLESFAKTGHWEGHDFSSWEVTARNTIEMITDQLN